MWYGLRPRLAAVVAYQIGLEVPGSAGRSGYDPQSQRQEEPEADGREETPESLRHESVDSRSTHAPDYHTSQVGHSLIPIRSRALWMVARAQRENATQ